jgi:pimeloyl-ACP methyl ester carboxylesterase
MVVWLELVALIFFLFLLFGLRFFNFGTLGEVETIPGDHKTLVVFGPPLGGRTDSPNLEKLVRQAYPTADILIPTYRNSWFSNLNPYDLTDLIECAIRAADDQYHYAKIILFGYSVGGLLLRKVYVWGSGFEDDRSAPRGRHPWVDRVDRFVSLAAPNRGWPTDKPENLAVPLYVAAYVIERLAHLTGTGRFAETLMQGSPFVANMRVQWIERFRALWAAPDGRRPLVIHLIGGKDELVDREDSVDLEAGSAAEGMIKTLEGLSHAGIAKLLYQGPEARLSPAGEAIQMALTKQRGEFPPYWADRVNALQTDPNINHLIFVMHGIRDESTWPEEMKRSIERQIGDRAATIKIVPPLYRRFTMLPFLLYWDRQHNVRWFMDQYTQAKAMYPNLETIDFIGHSNGTYILASALQRYPVLKVRNVFFAGSVVPVHYNWAKPIRDGRVTGRVWNICADGDWVVAIFPQLFQQISDWLQIKNPQPGLLDIGSAGFHGFRVGVGTAENVFNLKYISGDHGAAFEPAMVDPIAAYVTTDPAIDFIQRWRPEDRPEPTRLEKASNLSWLIWIVGLGGIVAIGIAAHSVGWFAFAIYAALLLGLLTTW